MGVFTNLPMSLSVLHSIQTHTDKQASTLSVCCCLTVCLTSTIIETHTPAQLGNLHRHFTKNVICNIYIEMYTYMYTYIYMYIYIYMYTYIYIYT